MYMLKREVKLILKKCNIRRYFDIGVFRKRMHISCCGWVSLKLGSAKGMSGFREDENA
jgi:hypothetical protein